MIGWRLQSFGYFRGSKIAFTKTLLHFWILNIVLSLLAPGCCCLKNVTLVISPTAVQRGKNVSLFCHYDLEGQQLYAVKWYRGQYEFYRYNPSEIPNRKIFIFPGIKVDLSQSNGSQVVLCDVGFNLSGNLSCEVTTEGPGFVTAVAMKHMMVVDLPKNGPTILTNKNRYDPGDILIANCSSFPSKPAADLRFHVNNMLVGEQKTKILPGPESLLWSFLQINITLLPSHFDDRHGVLPISCTAIISTLYDNSTELRLAYRKEPIPERVTSKSIAAFSRHFTTLPFSATLVYLAKRLTVYG